MIFRYIKSDNLLVALIIATDIFFHEALDDFISNLKVIDSFAKLDTFWLKDIAMIGILCALLSFFINLKNINKFFQALLIISVHYIGCRWFQHFDFLEIFYDKNLFYADLVLLLLIFCLVIYIKRKIKKSNQLPIQTIHDPLTNSEDDKFARNLFAKTFVIKILNSKQRVFGLEGPWGSGKTTTLNFIKNKLKEEKALVIEFNPWYCLNTTQIIPEFMSLLETRLETLGIDYFNFNKISTEVKKYIKLLSTEYQSVLELFFISKTSRQEEFNELNELLRKAVANKKIYVLIDDIDRLDNEKVLETLKLIKLIAHFDILKFIVAYDKEHLIQALKKADFDILYLDKIFPLEISLPLIEGSKLTEYLMELIELHLEQENSEEDTKRLGFVDNHNLRDVLDANLLTVREVIKIYSSFVSSYIFLRGEILVEDLLVLEVLRNKSKYHKVYKNLSENRQDLICFKNQEAETNILFLAEDFDQRLNSVFELNQQDIPCIEKIFTYLFLGNKVKTNQACLDSFSWSEAPTGKESYEYDPRSIRHEFSYRLYFTYGYNELKISTHELLDFLKEQHAENWLNDKIKIYTSQVNASNFFNLLKNKALIKLHECYENFFYTIFKIAHETKNAHESIWLAKLLFDYLPTNSEANNQKTQEIYSCLKNMMQDQANFTNQLFLLKITESSLTTFPQRSIFQTWDEVTAYTEKIFANYVSSDLVDGNYFLFLGNLFNNISKRNQDNSIENNSPDPLLQTLAESLSSNKEFFRSFLKMTIYDNKNQSKKTLWTRLYKEYSDLIIQEGIYRVFQGEEGLRNFINSIDQWNDEGFVQVYKKFMEDYFTNNSPQEIDLSQFNPPLS